MKWWYVGDPHGGWKTHAFPEAIKDMILADIGSRGMNFPKPGEFLALEETDTLVLDMGGPCSTDEPMMYYPLGEAKLEIAVTQVGIYLEELETLPVRNELAEPYYKVHGRWHCLCLRPEDRDSLIEQIKERLPEAQALAKIEDQKWNRFADKMQKERPLTIVHKKPIDDIGEAL